MTHVRTSYLSVILIASRDKGQYWGEMGYMRLELGKNLLGIEAEIAWATPGSFTVHNFPCGEDGKGCNGKEKGQRYYTQYYKDPSEDLEQVQRRLKKKKSIRG